MLHADLKKGKGLWDDCLKYMALRVKKHSFNTWFKHTAAVLNGGNELKIIVPNQFVADWLEDRYSGLIAEAIEEIHGGKLVYRFEVNGSDDKSGQVEINFHNQQSVLTKTARPDPAMNERYRFDNFVVGKFNQFAHAAALAVAEAPGKTNYNPLLIYGGTGLGKTHLIQAVGHHIVTSFPKKRSIYATSEKFTSDFISSISNGTIENFTSRYRTADLLLIDDIQFFSGKESTQEQFFHTFNDLFHSGKQIVMTSDRHPRDIKGLEERLLSRFSSGLVADLQPPDLETRIAILRMHTLNEKIDIPENVLLFIAQNITNNIRELEGSFNKLLAHSSLEKTDIDFDFAKRILEKEIRGPNREITINQIQKKAAEFFQIDSQMMTARKKTSQVALARQVAMFLSRKFTNFSLKSIGEAFGGRDHSTVIHACELVENKIQSDLEFKDKIDCLMICLTDRKIS